MEGAVLLATDPAIAAAPPVGLRNQVTTAALFRASPPGPGVATYIAVRADTPDEETLTLAAEGRAAGLWLTGCRGLADLEGAGARLAVAEARAGLDVALRIVASVGTASGVLALPGMSAGTRRLAGFALNEGALRLDLGRPGGGPPPAALLQARSMLVLAAAAARVPAIDAITDDPAPRAVEAAARLARQDGFAGKLALGTAQVPPIERAFA